ncbi:VanZ family protein (plasmid) [Paraclostridium ghonii]|uniref:VanZ family protein n=1 Tax=Paraclostridium ghonii TaxID=29358 RepID=UPI00202CC178|nr:VanZ family protein [Paeniclostridium ghonii]MCM0165091.1 VanZ family protein [Paeniclostridium ghonii]
MSRIYNILCDANFYSLLCLALPCLIYQIIIIKRMDLEERKYLVPHLIWVYIFLMYIYLALNVAGIGTIWDIGQHSGFIRINEINLIPFRSDGIITYILNIIMFMPLGFLLPFIWEDFRNLVKVLYTGFLFSLAIEISQLFNNRATDIDDLIMNTLGAILGYFVYVGVSNLLHSINKKTVSVSKDEDTIQSENADHTNKKTIYLSKNEAITYLILAILGEFFLYNWNLIA